MKVRIDPIDKNGKFDLTFYNSEEYNDFKLKVLKYLKDEGFIETYKNKTIYIQIRNKYYEVIFDKK